MRNPIPKFLIAFTISWHGFSNQPTLVNPNHPDFWANAIADSAQKNINIRMFELEKMIDLVDMENSEDGLRIVPNFLENKSSDPELDMIEGAWLCYAFNKSPQLSKNKTAFQTEYDAIIAYLQSIDQHVIKYKVYPKNKTVIQLSIWRKNNDLKTAILFLLYRPDFANELSDLLKNNPNVVSKFFAKVWSASKSKASRAASSPWF